MPVLATMDATWMNPSSVQYNAQELRRADATMFNGDGSAFGVLGGIVRHGDSSLAVSVDASDNITVQAGGIVIPAGAGNGTYRTGLGAATSVKADARNASLGRVDRVVFRILDTDVVASTGGYTGQVEVLTGTPNATPASGIAALPSLAIELARVTVPANGGGAATIDSSFRSYTTGLGGTLAVQSASRLPSTDVKWDRAVAIDTGLGYTWNGATWIADDTGAVAMSTTWAQAIAVAVQRRSGWTQISGRITVPSSNAYGSSIATIPVGFRPLALGPLVCYASDRQMPQIVVYPDGRLTPFQGPAAGGYIDVFGSWLAAF